MAEWQVAAFRTMAAFPNAAYGVVAILARFLSRPSATVELGADTSSIQANRTGYTLHQFTAQQPSTSSRAGIASRMCKTYDCSQDAAWDVIRFLLSIV